MIKRYLWVGFRRGPKRGDERTRGYPSSAVRNMDSHGRESTLQYPPHSLSDDSRHVVDILTGRVDRLGYSPYRDFDKAKRHFRNDKISATSKKYTKIRKQNKKIRNGSPSVSNYIS